MADPIRIRGVTPRSLLGYLKGLGLFTAIARQADPAARAAWAGGSLLLHTRLDRSDIGRFLLDEWSPAPVVSPWNGGSGFFPKDDRTAFAAIEVDVGPRLAPFRQAIAAARTALAELGLAEKPDPKTQKPQLLRLLRASLPDAALEWLDAAVVLIDDKVAYPPVLGSGGNDGRYDLANNYAQAVVAVTSVGVSGVGSAETLAAALWGAAATLRSMSLGHLLRDKSPVNSPAGEADALGNPWELVLAIQGALLMAGGAGRRLDSELHGALVAPWTFHATGAGYGSAVGREKGRAEMWLPVWEAPARLVEVELLLREGRARVGRRSARDGLDAARAAGELGVARGVTAFERFSILERAGQSNLAVFAGEVDVRPRPAALALRTLDPWLGRVLAHANGDVPRRQREAIRRLEQATFRQADRGDPASVVATIVALGRVESALALSSEKTRPIGLRPPTPAAAEWLAGLDPRRLEHRLAAAFASMTDPHSGPRVPTLRDYLHGTTCDGRGRCQYGTGERWVAHGAGPVAARLAAAHERRHQDAGRADLAQLGFPQAGLVRLADLAAFVAGTTDDRLLGDLIDGLCLLDFRGAMTELSGVESHADPLLDVLALAFHDPRRVPQAGGRAEPGRSRPRPGWVARLQAGGVVGVTREAILRLRLAGLPVIPRAEDLQTSQVDGVRLAAALMARPAHTDLWRRAELLTTNRSHSPPKENTNDRRAG